LRYRNQAAAILAQLGRGRYATLRDLVKSEHVRANSRVYEVALHGPFIKYFSKFAHYTRSYLWPNVRLGDTHKGVACQDITQLTFESDSFDLVISSDVLEHVEDYPAAMREIFRVLRPGGAHVLSVPIVWPMPEKTIRRVELVDGELVHRLEPRFHKAGDGTPSLVYTDFGFDILDLLQEIGYDAWYERPSLMRWPGYFDALLVCRKPRAAAQPRPAQKITAKAANKPSGKKSKAKN